MKSRLKELLIRAGLSENEAIFYLTALENPTASLADVCMRSRLSTATAYRIAESLAEKELIEISKEHKKNRRVFIKSIRVLCKKLDRRIQALARLSDELIELSAFYKEIPAEDDYQSAPPVEVFHGQDALREWYFRIPEYRDTRMLGQGSVDGMYSALGFSYEDVPEQKWIDKTVKNGLLKTVVFLRSAATSSLKQNDKKDLRFLKFNDEQPLKNGWAAILPDLSITFLFGNLSDPMVVVTHNAELLELQKKNFEVLWSSGKSE